MIVVQAAKGLDQDGKNEIIDKINNSESENSDLNASDNDFNDENEIDNEVSDDDTEIKNELGIGDDVNESCKIIDEILNDVMYNNNKDNISSNKSKAEKSYRKKPFTNPKIK